MHKVVITGASSGLGWALAEAYARRGAVLALIARRVERIHGLGQSHPGRISVYGADVRDATALHAAARDFISKSGAPDLVIANAGVSVGTATEQPDDNAVFEEVFAINVRGMMQTFQAFLPAMKDAASGTLVGIASVAGLRGLPGSGAYSASKAAAITYLESLRVELRQSGIAVVTICPGFIATPMTERNPYPMPFILSANDAAKRMVKIIERRERFAVVPWQMAIVGAVLRRLPGAFYDWLFRHAPRKPRRGQISA